MADYPFCASSARRQLPARLFCQVCDKIWPLGTMWLCTIILKTLLKIKKIFLLKEFSSISIQFGFFCTILHMLVTPHWECTIFESTSPFNFIAVAQRRVLLGCDLSPEHNATSHPTYLRLPTEQRPTNLAAPLPRVPTHVILRYASPT